MGSILCAINESAGATGALRVAAQLCDRLELRLVVVHVVEDVPLTPLARREARAGGLRLVERILAEQGVLAEWHVRIGDPAEEISEIAGHEEPELVITGSKPNGRRLRPPLRSRLAVELEHMCSAPVVVVPPRLPTARRPKQLRASGRPTRPNTNRNTRTTEGAASKMNTLIVPIDGSGSERALLAAEKLATQFDARLVLVHVQQLIVGRRGGRLSAHVNEAGRLARVRELVARLRADGFDAELETHRTSLEHPANIIADAAKRHDADAIVLATRGHTPVIGLLASSVAQRLLHIAPCPVVAVTPGTTHETFRWATLKEPTAA
jgi:nucleotide-binding universal stress UspA family protein